MFWTIVGAAIFIFIGLPIIVHVFGWLIGVIADIQYSIKEWQEKKN